MRWIAVFLLMTCAPGAAGQVPTVFGIDTQLSAGPFDFRAEHLTQHFEPDNQVPLASFRAGGWYAQAAVFQIPSRLQALTRYETLDPLRTLSGLDTQTWTTGINYYFRDHAETAAALPQQRPSRSGAIRSFHRPSANSVLTA